MKIPVFAPVGFIRRLAAVSKRKLSTRSRCRKRERFRSSRAAASDLTFSFSRQVQLQPLHLDGAVAFQPESLKLTVKVILN